MSRSGYWLKLFMKCIIYAMLGTLISMAAFGADQVTGKVVSVIDGNTVEVVTADSETHTIIFHGIDCPEMEQEFGEKAKRFLEKLILEKSVTITFQGKDRWGNRLAIVLIDGEIDPRFELLEQGLAWTSERNPIVELEAVREKAKDKGKGLWKEANPTPPWIFRRQQTMLVPKSS